MRGDSPTTTDRSHTQRGKKNITLISMITGVYIFACRGVYGTGFEATFTIDLPGFGKAEKSELEKAANELFLDIVKG